MPLHQNACITHQIEYFFSFQTDPYQVSFHIPLHRYLAAFTCQAVRAQGITLKEILPTNSLLQLIMMHPLRIQVRDTSFSLTFTVVFTSERI